MREKLDLGVCRQRERSNINYLDLRSSSKIRNKEFKNYELYKQEKKKREAKQRDRERSRCLSSLIIRLITGPAELSIGIYILASRKNTLNIGLLHRHYNRVPAIYILASFKCGTGPCQLSVYSKKGPFIK